ncbi:hypothetical protein CCAX7_54480 [Capsulimonas corticalis]|uniref:Uncharacterized protein n=1 Tax=Capsulimonas corticalis TaxID=2219043 RepID=A0A402D5V0_9BACT|nr:hypothetical protein [Capsulimonas corticalis]BDI33397.1 hypothetical protein CCAX7_54480 [Capsulimonas corticalis]
MIYIDPATANRLNRNIHRQGPQHPEARRVVARATTADMNPVTGAHTIMHGGTDGSQRRQTTSLNIILSTGDLGKAFHWGVVGFGWGEGVL